MTEAGHPALSEVMLYRPVSQMVKVFVLPEIDRRVGSGAIQETSLPLQVYQFRVVEPGGVSRVELNEEVQLTMKGRAKKAVKAGQLLRPGDLDLASMVLEPPIVDGTPRSFFLLLSAFLNLRTAFDFTQSGSGPSAPPMQFPIAELVQMKAFLATVRPVEKFRQLASLNWPPAPGYFPNVIAYAHANPEDLKEPQFTDKVADAYDAEFWQGQIDLWTQTKLFPGRLHYIRKAVDEYSQDDWISSIYVIVPQFEGIIRDYLRAVDEAPTDRFKDMVRQLRKLVFSRRVLLFPAPVLELILTFLETGTFWKNTTGIDDPTQEINRHGIVHGSFIGFEAKDIALKYLVLVDALALLLLHDRIVCGTL